MIIFEKGKKNKKKLVEKNVNKITILEVARILSLVDLNDKYIGVISNINIDIIIDLGLTNIKKY